MPFGTWQFGKIGVLVNFITQKLKSKHLGSLSQFSLVTGFFEGRRDNILHIFRALDFSATTYSFRIIKPKIPFAFSC